MSDKTNCVRATRATNEQTVLTIALPRGMADKNSPKTLTVIGSIIGHPQYAEICLEAKGFTADANLGWLIETVREIVSQHFEFGAQPKVILPTAMWAFGWLRALHLSQEDIVLRVCAERLRQAQLFTARKITFKVCSPLVDWRRKLRILAEEVGEVAHAIDQLEPHPQCRAYKAHLVDELVQVAAVSVAWLESFEGRSSTCQ